LAEDRKRKEKRKEKEEKKKEKTFAPSLLSLLPAMASNVIEIPLKNRQNEVIELSLDELPQESQEIIGILREEEVPLELWLRFAVEYFRRSRPDAFHDILSAALSSDLAHVYHHQRRERILILNALASYYVGQAAKEKVSRIHPPLALVLSLSHTHSYTPW